MHVALRLAMYSGIYFLLSLKDTDGISRDGRRYLG